MLNQPARPGDVDAIDLRISSQAEVQPQVVLRKIAAASANFIELNEFSGVNGEARANGGAVTLRTQQLEFNPVVSVGQMVAQQSRRFADIQNQDIDCTIIPNIAKRNAATGSQGQIREPGSGGSVFECAVVLIK